MFRSTIVPSPIEEAVVKATDENMTSENWELILAVCDKVNENPEHGAREAVQALQKRLAHRSGNVQLYSLALTESLAQNCGPKMQREMASRAFTQSLVRMGSDRSIHTSVKLRLLEVLDELVNAFKGDATLDLLSETAEQIKAMNSHLRKPEKETPKPVAQSNPSTEDEELQLALALSLQESKQHEEAEKKTTGQQSSKDQAGNFQTDGGIKMDPNAPISRVKTLYDLTATGPGELSFRKGDIIYVLEAVYHGWWRGALHGQVGIFPLNYVTPLPDISDDSSQDEEDEAKVFAEAANIDRLLALISNPNTLSANDSTELERLYKSTMASRPLMIKLIDRYGSRKEEMLELNERFKSSMQKYESILDSYVQQYNTPQPISYGHSSQYAPRY